MSAASQQIRPFSATVTQPSLDDLHDRLDRVRWTSDIPGSGPGYGVSLPWLQRLVAYWRDGYDWRSFEARLNSYPQFITEIDGQDIHFLHVRSPEPDALPLILTHGWPGSVAEYLDLIGPLTDPRAHGKDPAVAFDLVIPSLPGFAFSAPLTERGWGTQRTAAAWAQLIGVAGFAGDFSGVRRFAERDHKNIVQWIMHPEPGGHYAAHLEPDVLADDIRGFYRGLR